VVFDALPGVPIPAGGDAAIAALARSTGELLAAFRALPTDGLELDDLWADPERRPRSRPPFLAGAGLDADAERIRALQVLRMLELVAERRLAPEVQRIVADKLRAELG